jgi:hypothetical protein
MLDTAWRKARVALLAALCAGLAVVMGARSAAATPAVIVPPHRIDAGDVPYPPGAHGDASVTLVVVVDPSGRVSDVAVHEGASPFADAAASRVRTWRFAAATKDDEPIAAKITVVLSFHEPRAMPPLLPPPSARAPAMPPTTEPPAPPPEEVFVKGEREEPSTIHIPRTDTRFVAGAFGDPLKVVEVLPGMVPWRSGLPYYYVRGAPPENVGYFIDGISVPLLFHVGPGPSTIAPALVDSVDIFPGAYPARFGRYAGAVITAETTEPEAPQDGRPHGEFSARVYDANAYAITPYDNGQGTVSVSGRYGYTGLITSLIVPDYSLGYWDYQVRASHKLQGKDTFTLFAFGAHDELHYRGAPTFRVEYHRVDLRYDHPVPGGNLRIAATAKFDDALTALQTNTGAGTFAAQKDTGGRLRAELDETMTREVRLRAGADVSVTDFSEDTYPSIDGFKASVGPHTDVEGGAYGDVVWRPLRTLEVVPGVRFDGYQIRGQTRWAPQPRLATRLKLTREIAWLSALGTAHQEPTEEILAPSKIPSPIDQAPQTIYQYSEGIEAKLPSNMRVRVTGFYSHLIATDILGTSLSAEGDSGGGELFVQRDFSERLGGFLSYTLSRTVQSSGGVTTRVAWDRTHVVSLVLGYDLGNNWRVGARLFAESGRPYPEVCVANCNASNPVFENPPGNLPIFWRVDTRLEKRWVFQDGKWLAGTVECFNTFDKAEPSGDEYVPGRGLVVLNQSAIILPSIGIEGGL